MTQTINLPAAIKTIRALVAELEARVEHPENYSERERRQQVELLQVRRLELADLVDQANDSQNVL